METCTPMRVRSTPALPISHDHVPDPSRSLSEVSRTCRGSTNYFQTPTLFHKVAADSRHVLHQLLPPLSSASQNYRPSLRHRTNQFSLPDHTCRPLSRMAEQKFRLISGLAEFCANYKMRLNYGSHKTFAARNPALKCIRVMC